MEHVESELGLYVLGELGEAGRLHVERHLRVCRLCDAQRRELERGLRVLPPTSPPVGLWATIGERVEGPQRYLFFLDRVRELFDVSAEVCRDLLLSLDDSRSWQEGPASGVSLAPIHGGPRCAGAMTTFVRIRAGSMMPRHEHGGREEMFVLQGGFKTDSGTETWRGEACLSLPGTAHELSALPGPDCVAAVTLRFDP